MVKKVREKLQLFNTLADKHHVTGRLRHLLRFALLRIKYHVSVPDYFRYRFFDKNDSHELFKKESLDYRRTWKYVRRDLFPDATLSWKIRHYIDYHVMKPFYPGLDSKDYFMYHFYEFRHVKRKTFITRGYSGKINRYFNGGESRQEEVQLLRDKAKFNEFVSDIITRKWLVVTPENRDEFVDFCLTQKEVFFKPLRRTRGEGMFRQSFASPEEALEIYEKIKEEDYIAEEVIKQAKELSELNSSSVNTIRVNTIKKDGVVHIVNAFLHIGREGAIHNQFKSIFAAINLNTGIVHSEAVTVRDERSCFHLDSGKLITGFQVPSWDQVLAVVKDVHGRLKTLGYVSFDIIVQDDYSVTIVEANTGGGVSLQQVPFLEGWKPVYDKFMKDGT